MTWAHAGGATQPLRPNYEHRAPCPRPGRLPRAASPQVGRTPGISCEGRDLRWRRTVAATPWRLPPTMPRSSSNRPSSASSPCSAAAVTHPTCRQRPFRTAPDRTPESRNSRYQRDPGGRGTARLIRSARRPGCGAPLEEHEGVCRSYEDVYHLLAVEEKAGRGRPRCRTEKSEYTCAQPRREEAGGRRSRCVRTTSAARRVHARVGFHVLLRHRSAEHRG